MAGDEVTGLGEFKGQPWIVYDTIAARSFLVGENRPAFFAFGTSGPAITSAGEMVFFASGGRNKANMPWYTNLELNGQLSYGFEVWQMYLHFGFPQVPNIPSDDPQDAFFGISYPVWLAAAILNFGELELNLGQEIQTTWPLNRFGAGGGYSSNPHTDLQAVQSSIPNAANVLALAEPIEIPRTQNLDARIRLAPEAIATIGHNVGVSGGAGFGTELSGTWPLTCPTEDEKKPETVELPFPPYTVQLGLIGRRVKKTQYGQTPNAG
jgi:hypothetical protein